MHLIKVMIADDESLIRKGLLSLIDWRALDCEVVFAACNGQQVLEHFDEFSPDIIISDIKMPVMDGLMLAEHLYKHRMRVKIILLTAFADFDYARKAISFGVSQYITKDGNMESIVQAVEQCKLQLAKEQQAVQSDNEKAVSLIKNILDGTIYSPSEILDKAAAAALLLDSFCILLIDSSQGINVNTTTSRENIRRLLDLEFQSSKNYIVPISKVLTAIVLEATSISTATQAATELCGSLAKLMGWNIFIGISEIQCSVTMLNNAYKQAQNALSLSFYDKCYTHDFSCVKNNSAEYNSFAFLSVSFGEALRCGQADKAMGIIEAMFAQQASSLLPEAQARNDLNAVITFCKRALSRIGASFEDLDTSEETLQNALIQARFFDDCRTILLSLVQSTCRCIESIIQNGTDIAADAQNFIDAHFRENITLKSIAQAVNANPSYLSRYFKQKTGANIVDTITQKRMEAAKESIAEGKMKMYEIACSIGMEDTTYFSHVFRKYTGMSPKAYQDFITRIDK